MAGPTNRKVIAGPRPAPFLVDAGEERQNGARADRQHEPPQGRGRIGHVLRGRAAQVARDGLFGHQRSQRAGDEEGRQQAQQHVRGQVRRQTAQARLQQLQNERDCIHESCSNLQTMTSTSRPNRSSPCASAKKRRRIQSAT